MNPSLKPFLFTDIEPGQHLPGDAVGVCVQSDREDIQVGDYVVHRSGMSEYSKILDDADYEHWYKKSWIKVIPKDVDPLLYLGVCGLAGLTAYIGMKDILKLESGMTVGISGASGTCGVLLGQMAIKHGCKVVGFTSTQEKADWLKTPKPKHMRKWSEGNTKPLLNPFILTSNFFPGCLIILTAG